MCEASETSLSHPDYCDWVCIKYCAMYRYIYLCKSADKCDRCKCWTHAHCTNMTITETKKSTFFCIECYQNKHDIEIKQSSTHFSTYKKKQPYIHVITESAMYKVLRALIKK